LLGQGFAIRVKDEKKVEACLRKIGAALQRLNDGARFQDRQYRGVTMRVLTGVGVPDLGVRNLPLTCAVHKGWLVVGLFPQSVKGFILRSEGRNRTWKAPGYLEQAVARSREGRGKVVAVTVRDPRPLLELGLSFLPLLNQFLGADALDASRLPNAQTVAEHLFPSVTVLSDEGTALRWDCHYSIFVPDELVVPLVALMIL
jgi:hypothetical protein